MRLTWWKALTRKAPRNSLCSHGQLRGRDDRRPQLERLESRLAPATHTWTGATSGLWSDNTNWNGGAPAGDPMAALVFPAGAQHRFGNTNTNDLTNLTIQSITVSDDYGFTGNGLTLNGVGITLKNAGAFNSLHVSVELPITLGSNQVWTTGIGDFLEVGGDVSGVDSAALTKDGTGRLTLIGSNSYTGTTTVAAGTLEVDGSQPSSNVIVNSGATLGGSGTVGAITTSGVIEPSALGPGILHSGNVTFNPGSSLHVVLGVTNVNVSLPKLTQLDVTGAVNLSGNPTLMVIRNLVPTVGGTFTPITSTGAIGGTFNGLPDNSTLTGLDLRINYQTGKVVLTALPPNHSYVTQLYFDLLRRQPDTGGLTFWTGALDQSKATRSEVAAAFVNSPEYQMQEVKDLYQKFFHRDADPIGLSGWTQFLVQGHTLEELAAQIVASPEYLQTRVAANTNNFVATLFRDAFNRPLDQNGLGLFGDQDVDSNRDRRQLAERMFGTDEFRLDLVRSYYQRFLNRSGDPAGSDAALAALKNGTTDETLITVIVGSPEYLGLASRVLVPLGVKNL
jgi:autotransporter-associated beta strand protein